jgi:hypothetical protein
MRFCGHEYTMNFDSCNFNRMGFTQHGKAHLVNMDC